MKKGAIYVRVSSEEQARDGYSIDAQIKALKDYAIKNDIFLEEQYIYKDEGISGRVANKRPAFMEMIKTAKSKPKKFDVILVHKFDRFSRNREDSIVYKSLLKKECGINVISITEHLDPDDKMSIILEAFLEAMAEYYSINLSEEVKKGQLEKHSQGGLQTNPSFGYNVENNKLIINEQEEKIVKLIFESYAIENKSMMEIAKKVNSLGILTKRGNKFENRTIYYILNNPTYIGKLRYTPGRKNTYDFNDPNTILVDGKHTPIITNELWGLTQLKLSKNNIWKKPKSRIDYSIKHWSKGIIRCKECNCTLVTSGVGKYRCNGYNKGKCSNHATININEAESLILGQIKKDFNEGTINNIVPNRKEKKSINEYDIITSSITSLEEKEERIKQSYINGIDTLEEYKQNKEMLLKEKERLTTKLSTLEKPSIEKYKKEIIENGKKVYEILTNDKISLEEKNDIVNKLINKVEYDGEINNLTIFYN